MSKNQENNETIVLSDAILFMISLLVCNELLQNQFLKLSQQFPLIKRYINNTILTTLVGIIAAIYLRTMKSEIILTEYRQGFSKLFLIVLLPPILFESAINMEKALFFQNFGSILLYAIFGTAIATLVTGFFVWTVGIIGIAHQLNLVHSFAFGSLISATDPVAVLGIFKTLNANKKLYILIYGESILNDAIAIILYTMCVEIQQNHIVGAKAVIIEFILNFSISILIGFFIGVFCAYILKIKYELNYETENIEVSVTILIPWISYLIAEAVGYSGIVSIVFCGIVMARYALPNLTENGKQLLNKFYHFLSYNFENLVFLFIGIGMVGFNFEWIRTGIGLAVSTIIIVLLARLANIKIISGILNKTSQQIKQNHQLALWFYGLRGAMAYALSLDSLSNFPDGEIILTLTMIIVFLNIFVQGCLLEPMMEKCEITYNEDLEEEEINNEDHIFSKLKKFIETFDEKILQQYLIKQSEIEI